MVARRAADVLDFWLGPESGRDSPPSEVKKGWWRKSPAFDAEIRERFGVDVERAGAGEYEDWAEDVHGLLAVVILLDQFTRNIHRDSGRMYDHDERAQALALRAVDDGLDRDLPAAERMFLYMPLMHAENPEHQRRCVDLFEIFCEECPEFSGHLKYATDHRDIVERFGRFPHRNALLGRECTEEEDAFLKQPGSSF